MGSLSDMLRRIPRRILNFLHVCLGYCRLNPLWAYISWIPGTRLLCRAAGSLPWPGRAEEEEIRNEPEQTENKLPEKRRSSSDVEKANDDHCGGNSKLSAWQPESKAEEEEEFRDEYRVDKTDEFYCDYDSTWESESFTRRNSRRSRGHRNYAFSRFENAARDMWNYRHDYPNLHRTFSEQEYDAKPNLNFYLGNIPSAPDGVYIHDFHNEWKGKYAKLELVHTFIQWLFPLQEPGVNYEAKTLTKQEIQEFLDSDFAKENLLKSYELMLDFYGIELTDQETGEVTRAEHWSERFQNLNNHTHNNLRITRILKCLGTLGYQHYQVPLVRFFLKETLVNGELPSVRDSALSYFLFAVLDKRERRKLLRFAYEHYEPKEEFVWCPKKIQMLWSNLRQEQNQMNYQRDVWGNNQPY